MALRIETKREGERFLSILLFPVTNGINGRFFVLVWFCSFSNRLWLLSHYHFNTVCAQSLSSENVIKLS